MESRNNQNRCPWAGHIRQGTTAGRIVGWSLVGLAVAIAFALIFGSLVKLLWGYTLTPLFHVPEPTYLQAVGIILLARLIFGNPGHGHGRDKRGRIADRFHDRFHPRAKDDTDDLETRIRSTEGDRYERFWETEGRQAFERYLEQGDPPSKKP